MIIAKTARGYCFVAVNVEFAVSVPTPIDVPEATTLYVSACTPLPERPLIEALMLFVTINMSRRAPLLH